MSRWNRWVAIGMLAGMFGGLTSLTLCAYFTIYVGLEAPPALVLWSFAICFVVEMLCAAMILASMLWESLHS